MNHYEEVSKITQLGHIIRYVTDIPSPHGTMINVYHNTTNGGYVEEYPASGSSWNIIGESKALELISHSVSKSEYDFPLKFEYNRPYIEEFEKSGSI